MDRSAWDYQRDFAGWGIEGIFEISSLSELTAILTRWIDQG